MPIDLAGFMKALLKPMQISCEPGPGQIVNDGHYEQVGLVITERQTVSIAQAEPVAKGMSFASNRPPARSTVCASGAAVMR